MKYAIQVNLFMYDEETDVEYKQWHYVAVEGKHKLFMFEKDITKDTKLFDTATEAGAYVDKHFGLDKVRFQYSTVRIKEVEV